MAHKIKLYMFTGSAPSMTARLMLEHKSIEYTRAHLLIGPHAIGMLWRGFVTMTVPALKIDGRRVQGSREISRALDELVAQRALFPADPVRRQAVDEAERWGETFQDATRRLVRYASRQQPRLFSSIDGHPNPLLRAAQRMSRALVIRLASAGHRATDRAAQEDLAALPACLDTIDAWIQEGPARRSRAQRCGLPDRAEHLAPAPLRAAGAAPRRPPGETTGRPRRARSPRRDRSCPSAPVGGADEQRSSAPRRSGPMGSDDALRAIGYGEQQIASVPHQPHG